MLIAGVDAGNEFLVVRGIEAGGVPTGAEGVDRLLAHQLENALVGARGISEHGEFPFQPVILELLQEAQRIAAGEAHVDAVHVGLDLRQVRRIVGRIERWPEFLHDLAAGRFEGELESAGALVAIGEILRDDRHSFKAKRLGRVIAQWVGHLRCRAEGVQHPGVHRVSLQIDGCCRGRGDERHFRIANVAVDRQGLVGRQWTDHHRYFVAFDQLLGLGPREGGIAGRILGDQLDLAARNQAAAFLEIKSRTLRLLLAAGGQRAGIDGEESNFERLRRLRKCAPRWQYAERCSAHQQRAARDRKFTVLTWHPRTP